MGAFLFIQKFQKFKNFKKLKKLQTECKKKRIVSECSEFLNHHFINNKTQHLKGKQNQKIKLLRHVTKLRNLRQLSVVLHFV